MWDESLCPSNTHRGYLKLLWWTLIFITSAHVCPRHVISCSITRTLKHIEKSRELLFRSEKHKKQEKRNERKFGRFYSWFASKQKIQKRFTYKLPLLGKLSSFCKHRTRTLRSELQTEEKSTNKSIHEINEIRIQCRICICRFVTTEVYLIIIIFIKSCTFVTSVVFSIYTKPSSTSS